MYSELCPSCKAWTTSVEQPPSCDQCDRWFDYCPAHADPDADTFIGTSAACVSCRAGFPVAVSDELAIPLTPIAI